MSYSDFTCFLNNYDIIGISETKLNGIDSTNVHVNRYYFYSLNRRSFTRRSGGVGAFVKSELVERHLITRVLDVCESNALWFRLHKELCGVEILCDFV